MKYKTNKTLVLGIVILFVGVGCSSAKSIDINSTKSNNESDQDCGCKTNTDSKICDMIYNRMLVILNKAKYIKELSEKYKDNKIIYELLIMYGELLLMRTIPLAYIAMFFNCDLIPDYDTFIFQMQLKNINNMQS